MRVSGPPVAGLIVVQPGLVHGLLEALLDVPAAAGDPGQVGRAGAIGPVADESAISPESLSERRACSQFRRPGRCPARAVRCCAGRDLAARPAPGRAAISSSARRWSAGVGGTSYYYSARSGVYNGTQRWI